MSAPSDPNTHPQANIQPDECQAGAQSSAGASPIAEYLDLMWQLPEAATDALTSPLPELQQDDRACANSDTNLPLMSEVNTPISDLTVCYSWQDVTSANLQLCLAMRLLILSGRLPQSRVRDLCLAAVATLLKTFSG